MSLLFIQSSHITACNFDKISVRRKYDIFFTSSIPLRISSSTEFSNLCLIPFMIACFLFSLTQITNGTWNFT